MSSPEITPIPEPEATGSTAADLPPIDDIQADAAGATVAALQEPEERRRRRRKALLILLLLGLSSLLLLFGGYYLLFRKPIPDLPLPGITQVDVPHYVFSIYGVTRPIGVAVSPTGDRIYVTETEGERVVRIFDGRGSEVGIARPPAAATGDHTPVYLALDPTNGDLYVSDRPAGAIYVYSKDGIYRRTFDQGEGLTGWQPLGLAFDAAGSLYVTDVSGPFNRVHQFDREGKVVRTIGEAGVLSFPNGVAVDPTGNVYVTDSNNGRLVVFDSSGRQRAVIGPGQNLGGLGLPRGTAIDDGGRLYIVDTAAHHVQLYDVLGEGDRAPRHLGSFGVEGTADGGFEFPFGVATDTRARVYVSDWNNNRVQVWSY